MRERTEKHNMVKVIHNCSDYNLTCAIFVVIFEVCKVL